MINFKKWFKKYHGESYEKSLSHNGYYSADKLKIAYERGQIDTLEELLKST